MPERIRKTKKISADEAARLRAVRSEYCSGPTSHQLLESGEYVGPMSIDEFLSWRKGAGSTPLIGQLKAAIAATPQSLYAISQGSGVAAPILQRFVNGERGITLETAGKVANYLGLVLLPEPARMSSSNSR